MIKKVSLHQVFCLFAISIFALSSCSDKRSGDPKVLVFSKTSGFHHSSIAAGNNALLQLGEENGFVVDTTTNAAVFNEDSLKQYSAVVFLNTTGDVLNNFQEADFERYIQAGGGFVGIHAATDTEYDWGWYGRLVGGYFNGHPEPQKAVLQVVNADHAATEHLPQQWERSDEWYSFKNLNTNANVLLTIDEKSYKGGTNGENHPMAWFHEYDGGRAFYTGLGHTDESFKDSQYLKHLVGGIQYAIGENLELDYEKATSQRVPEDDRFVKVQMSQGQFYEPTEMAILPNLDILVAQRRGELMLYNQESGDVKQVGALNVYHKTTVPDVNAEEGLMGLAADPNFSKNNYIYMFYSPTDTSVNRLSRFVFKNGQLDNNSEKVMLEFYSQRDICCHTGGSIAFGPGNILYLSTGDNSTPFNEKGQPYVNHGFAPLDDRPGHEQYDARRSSSNSNDLRGKILRIKINEDGTYTIPEGNLFPGNTPKTHPEIYTMGHRNPYRISVDQKNSALYWGEVGPDAGADSLEVRGPRGYDEVNQAREAGNYGWPLFIGDNYAYHRYDYAKGETGPQFDPQKPVNNSPNNTGVQELPAAQPAFIWYPYAESPDFPQLGTGGRNAMTGPVYYSDMYPEATRYSSYYDGKLFIYDWMRGWIKAVTMDENGKFEKMEPFMSTIDLNAPIDMEVGPDGKLYILEYGSGWFAKNEDSGLARIDYLAGNRPPKIAGLTVDKMSGKTPLTVNAQVEATDPENDRLRYIWTIGDKKQETAEPKLNYTFAGKGDHNISVEVLDQNNASSKSNVVSVYAGNEQPEVNVAVQGNRSFYFEGQPVNYQVKVTDEDGTVDESNLFVSADYVEGTDMAGASMGHQVVSAEMLGKNLMLSSDCKACHAVNEKSIGPTYMQVAQKYQKDRDAMQHLTNKIIKGGSGVWGEAAMPAHPNMPSSDAKQIVQWILSLGNTANARKSLPASGQVVPKLDPQQKDNTVLKLVATYTDQGGTGIKPLAGTDAVYLRNNAMDAADFASVNGFNKVEFEGATYLIFPGTTGWVKGEKLDLTNIGSIELTAIGNGEESQYTVEVRLDKPDGTKIGEGQISLAGERQVTPATISLQNVPANKQQDVYIVVKHAGGETGQNHVLKTVKFVPKSGTETAMSKR
ncbi:PKD domain-containing protein [Pontibacter diazotrophicus]|uniref:PKD domain-containing protein n=1 Tax=Pontibacter diazotrophicus TaxID=1400979 RepID=A0A3D8LFG5_9BACT|nr:ThuA domain-containing protein [Pontibacter diazotrophicus]RDV16189.1 PKD domain-containing protein [Pontibacter diazotrophicus]